MGGPVDTAPVFRRAERTAVASRAFSTSLEHGLMRDETEGWPRQPAWGSPATPAARVWSVGALVQAVGDTLAARYGAVTIRGEICGFNRAASGHAYFSLKDEHGQASLKCAMFRRAFAQVSVTLTEGMLVEATGRVSVYESRGELQLVVEGLRPAGAGALYEQFLRLKARLEAQGLFDADRKRPLPAFPRRVAVVTSLAAAALRDVVTTLQRRAPHVEAVVVPCAVQGAGAPVEIVEALARATGTNGRVVPGDTVDAIVLCRGGGALEDLWAFNDERVVRAVAASPVPVVCGVGHETDVTLADLAADVRAATPTAAAELVAPSRAQLAAQLQGWQDTLQWRLARQLDQQAQQVDRLSLRLSRPGRAVHDQQRALGLLQGRMSVAAAGCVASSRHAVQPIAARHVRAVAQTFAWQRRHLDHVAHRLHALDPQRVLERGYAWVSDAAGRVLAGAGQLRPGQRVHLHLADGEVAAQVLADPPGSPGRVRQPSAPTDEPDLFTPRPGEV